MWNWREIIIREFYRSINSNTLEQSEGWPQEPQNAIRSNQIPTAEVFVWIENEEIKLMLSSYSIELYQSSLHSNKKYFKEEAGHNIQRVLENPMLPLSKANEVPSQTR